MGFANLRHPNSLGNVARCRRVVSEDLWQEIAAALANPAGPDAYFITKGFHFLGKRFRFGGFSFAAVLLFREGESPLRALIE